MHWLHVVLPAHTVQLPNALVRITVVLQTGTIEVGGQYQKLKKLSRTNFKA